MLTGMIVIWSGAIVDIPGGFVICDGNNSTPDLRDKFVIGAGSTYAVDANGGGAIHSHGGSVNLLDGVGAPLVAAGMEDNVNTLPPYYAIAYIMKS